MPARPAGGRHATDHPPLDPPVRGSLPLPPFTQDAPTEGFAAVRGELPVEPPPATRGRPRRQKVTLTPPTCHEETPDDEDVRVYVAPPETGLSTFDLGSVPASVTPPRSWRKAAWFATASSGGVVVALLFAGSALVGKPAPDQAGGGWIPGLGGGIPTIGGEQLAPGPAGGGRPDSLAKPTTETLTSDDVTSTDPQPRTDPLRAPASATSADETTSGTKTSPVAGHFMPAPTTTPVPQKPPSTPAPYDADPNRFAWPQGDPATFAKDSQKFLDAVTANPQAASAMTTGALAQEGPQGIEDKYADVAYFQVEHVQVHQYDGKTVCTVKKVRKNGDQTTEQHTLTFQNGKISSDG